MDAIKFTINSFSDFTKDGGPPTTEQYALYAEWAWLLTNITLTDDDGVVFVWFERDPGVPGTGYWTNGTDSGGTVSYVCGYEGGGNYTYTIGVDTFAEGALTACTQATYSSTIFIWADNYITLLEGFYFNGGPGGDTAWSFWIDSEPGDSPVSDSGLGVETSPGFWSAPLNWGFVPFWKKRILCTEKP